MSYDSRPDTWEHIHEVQKHLYQIIRDLLVRAHRHDESKLFPPEVEAFDEFTPKLKPTTCGSSEYEDFRRQLGSALDHHYTVNDHHPEYFDNGICDMDLIQLTEMLADWKAATMRHDDGDLRKSINQNASRFGYGDEIRRLLLNTAEGLNWV